VSEICVVHLVRKKNGIEPFHNFLASYLRNAAGVEHELLILYKGFYREADIVPYEELFGVVPHAFLRIADFGFDLRSYFIAAEKCNSKYYCFLNSFSVILDKDWLLKLYKNISRQGVGIVGATGSWGSILPGKTSSKKNISLWQKLMRPLVLIVLNPYLSMYFNHFPNYHIRTNNFMISRDVLLKIHRGLILTKLHTYRLESGKCSITKQVEQMGLKPIVVGKDGEGYEKHEWDISNTFRRGEQKNLLISDNQSRKYDAEDLSWKQKWESFTWGRSEKKSLDQ
jgi:hypothetical protein